MNRKIEHEYSQLIKLGIPENVARLIAVSKYKPDSEEALELLEDEKNFQKEIKDFVGEFKKVEPDVLQSER